MKRIIFNLDEKWYNVIRSGKPEPETGEPKLIEYRKVCKHWASRLGFRFAIIHADNKEIKLAPVASNYNFYILDEMIAVFRVGYPSNYKPRKWPDIVRRITKIDIGKCPYEGWDGEYFRIHFEKGECK